MLTLALQPFLDLIIGRDSKYNADLLPLFSELAYTTQ